MRKKVIALFNTMGTPGLLPPNENFYSPGTSPRLTIRASGSTMVFPSGAADTGILP
jgi:hypothetical protein